MEEIKTTLSTRFSKWIIGVFITLLITAAGFIGTAYVDTKKALIDHKIRLAKIEQRFKLDRLDNHDSRITILETKAKIGTGPSAEQAHAEKLYWAWFRSSKVHRGIALNKPKAGENLKLEWWIPVRPVAAIEIQIAVILDEHGLAYKGTTGPFIVVPETATDYGRAKKRYRHSALDRNISHFSSTEGVPMPKFLKPGKYTMNYQYLFIDLEGNVTRVSTDQLIPFEISA